MEEKERYVVLSLRQIKDMQNQSQCFMSIEQVCKLLNQQSKRIKELEQENQQLKQSQKQLAIEELEKVKANINTYNKEHCFLFPEIDACNKSVKIIDKQIKELKGE